MPVNNGGMTKRFARLVGSALVAAVLAQPAFAVSDLQDYSGTAGTNTDIGGVSVAEGSPFANMNNALRELMAELKRGVAGQGSDIASATTTAICAAGTSAYAKVTGTTTITGLGNAAAGCWRIITFTGALTLTHNATSLIIPGAANITTVAGDVAGFVSEGSGNWRMTWFSRVPLIAPLTLSSTSATLATFTMVDAGAGAGPVVLFDRNSSTPAVADGLGRFQFQGRDSGSNAAQYGTIDAQISDPTDASEDGIIRFIPLVGGSAVAAMEVSNGIRLDTAGSAAFKGNGTLNAVAGLYVNGHGTVAQFVEDEDAVYQTLGTILPFDDTIPQITEGDELLSVAITPTNASSTLFIDVDVNGQVAVASNDWACAVFVDATANAIAARPTSGNTTSAMTTLRFTVTISAASTSARTYRVRCGSGAATDLKVNGTNAARLFGGVNESSLRVTEVLPQ